MNTSKGTARTNEEGATEIKVHTVDYRSPPAPAEDDQEPKKEDVVVTHLDRTDCPPGAGGVMSETAAKVAEKIQSAKEAIAGTHSSQHEKSK